MVNVHMETAYRSCREKIALCHVMRADSTKTRPDALYGRRPRSHAAFVGYDADLHHVGSYLQTQPCGVAVGQLSALSAPVGTAGSVFQTWIMAVSLGTATAAPHAFLADPEFRSLFIECIWLDHSQVSDGLVCDGSSGRHACLLDIYGCCLRNQGPGIRDMILPSPYIQKTGR